MPQRVRLAHLVTAALAPFLCFVGSVDSGASMILPPTLNGQMHRPAESWAPEYRIRGAIEVDTNENTLFRWHGELLVLENIPCYYSQHASRWDSRFANSSYARIRRMSDGEIVVNISSTAGFGFVSAFVDDDFETVWLFGSSCNRCAHGKSTSANGCRGSGPGGKVQSWSNRPNKTSLLEWDTATVRGTPETFNVEVTRVRSTASEQKAAGLPPHRYAMILEIHPRFVVSNGTGGDLTAGWVPIPGAIDPPMNGGPSMRWNPIDKQYYAILGGRIVELMRTRNFRTWERSPNAPFIKPSRADGQISPYAGFPRVAEVRGFLPMENTSLWDWNSNDADVCCMNDAEGEGSWVIWGAGTQGKPPKHPLTISNHCTNVVGTANVSLPQLLINHFEPSEAVARVSATAGATRSTCPLGWDFDGHAGNDSASDPLLYHPRFHIMPPTRKNRPTGMNDMNAVFFYNGLYHVTYQDHIDCPDDVNQANQSFGHVVSDDLIHWRHLPPALVDVPAYDGALGPWDGPGFVCNGRPIMIYNSHAEGPSFGRQTKTGAVPAKSFADDPQLKEWIHVPLDPPTAFIGPSTLIPPWRGDDGAYYTAAADATSHKCQLWRTTNTNCTQWEVVSVNFGFCANNNPELYLTPPPCDGCPQNITPGYTYVAKLCAGEGDGYSFGVLSEQNQFTKTSAFTFFEPPKRSQFEDGRSAWTESMADPKTNRRIMVGWVPPGVSPAYTKPFAGFPPLWHMCSLLRDVRYDDRLKILTSEPIAEYASLRTSAVYTLPTPLVLQPGASIVLGKGGRQLDIEAVFEVPNETGTSFFMTVLGASDGSVQTLISVARISQSPHTDSAYMPNVDLPGSDKTWKGVNYTDPHLCEADCATTEGCLAWTYVGKDTMDSTGYPIPRCCLKSSVPRPVPNPTCTSGVLPTSQPKHNNSAPTMWALTINTTASGAVPGHQNRYPTATMKFQVLPGETQMQLRVVLDRSIIEAFAMRGRAVVTATAFAPAGANAASVGARNGAGKLINVTAWSVGCTWIE